MSDEQQPTETRRTAFLAPGTTKLATWPGTASLAPITITFAPLNAIESGKYMRDMGGALRKDDVVQLKLIITKMLAKQIVTWDLADGGGQPVSVGEDVLLRQLDDMAVSGLQKLVEDSAETLEDAAKN